MTSADERIKFILCKKNPDLIVIQTAYDADMAGRLEALDTLAPSTPSQDHTSELHQMKIE